MQLGRASIPNVAASHEVVAPVARVVSPTGEDLVWGLGERPAAH